MAQAGAGPLDRGSDRDARWWLLLAPILVVGVATAFVMVVFPESCSSSSGGARSRSRAVGLLAIFSVITFATYGGLLWVFGSSDEWTVSRLVAHNLELIVAHGVMYPPLIGLALPTALAVMGYRSADQF